MNSQPKGPASIRWLSEVWERWVQPQRLDDPTEQRQARTLNASLFFLMIWGIISEILFLLDTVHVAAEIGVILLALLGFAIAYGLNRARYLYAASILTVTSLSAAVFALAVIQPRNAETRLSPLYYLTIVILLNELFFSRRGSILATGLILTGVAAMRLLHENVSQVLLFLFIFSALVGISSGYRRRMEAERRALAGKSAQDHPMLDTERRRTRQIELLNQITNSLLQMQDLREALPALGIQLAQLLEADQASIKLWEDEADSAAAEDADAALTAALREGRPVPVEGTGRASLALPLIAHGKKLGAALVRYEREHAFTPAELSLSEQAAGQIALAILKAQLFENEVRRAKQLALLEEVGRQIADSLDEHEIIQRTVQIVLHHFSYAEVAISLLTGDSILEVAAISGTEDFGYRPGYRQELGQGIIGHVAKIRQPYCANDVSQDPYYFSTTERRGSALAVPMFNKEELLGVIYVETSTRNHFRTDDAQTLQTMANQIATSMQKARLYARAQEHIQVMTTLELVSHVVTSSLMLNEILANVLKLLKNSFGYNYISIYLLDNGILRLGDQLGYPEELVLHEVPVTAGVLGRAVRSREAQLVRDVDKDPSFLRAAYEVKSEICVPLLRKDQVLGALNIESKSESRLDENDLNMLTALAGPLAVAIDNARLHAEMMTRALTDPLSGLANRRAFDEILYTEIKRAERYNSPLSLIILDLDSFKAFNDQYGHPAGDLRLKQISELLKQNVREPDVAARYGGEEFAIILPNTSKEGAVKLAERLRHMAEERAPALGPKSGPVAGYTISLGVATFAEDARTVEDLLIAADNAELTAKRLGKNRVSAASPLDPSLQS